MSEDKKCCCKNSAYCNNKCNKKCFFKSAWLIVALIALFLMAVAGIVLMACFRYPVWFSYSMGACVVTVVICFTIIVCKLLKKSCCKSVNKDDDFWKTAYQNVIGGKPNNSQSNSNINQTGTECSNPVSDEKNYKKRKFQVEIIEIEDDK